VTLYRQLIIAIATLFILFYGANSAVSIYHTQILIEQQMQVHAQDTATSVALSMTQAAQDKDIATLDTMFNAVSDSGYFQQMVYSNLDGKVLLNRTFPVKVEGVPDWFINAVNLSSPMGEAEVASGWMRLGSLQVISHPGQAYQTLWQVSVEQLTWFALITLFVCGLMAWALHTILKPLQRVEQQADAICDKQFVEQDIIPKTRELRSVVTAMNRMSRRLKSIFQGQLDLISSLQEQSHRDSITGLPNRLGFDDRLRSFTGPDIGAVSGVLMILRIDDFQVINDRVGRSEGNDILQQLGERLLTITASFSQCTLGRRQGAEFAVFIPNVIDLEVNELADTIFSHCGDVEWRFQDEAPLAIHMGLSHKEEIEDTRELLTEADAALQFARQELDRGWRSVEHINNGQIAPLLTKPVQEWRGILESALAASNIKLLYQPIYANKQNLVGHEVYSRLILGDELVAAGIFMPMAKRFGLATDFDRLVFRSLAGDIDKIPAQYLCVNLSISSIQDRDFHDWLDSFLSENSLLAKCLVVELSEHAIDIEVSCVRKLSELLERHKVRLAIDHFGLGSAAFGYLSSLPLHHIKVHRSFIYNIHDNPDNRFYVQSLIQVAQSRDILVIAEGVEQQEELDALTELGIDAVQGYLLGAPVAHIEI